jgi:hypothetical protein
MTDCTKGLARLLKSLLPGHIWARCELSSENMRGIHGSLPSDFSSVLDNLPVALPNATISFPIPVHLVSLYRYVYGVEHLAC